MRSYKQYYLIRIITTTVFGAAIGLLFFFARPYADEIFDVLLIAMGLMTAVMNLPAFFFSLFHVRRRGEWISLLISAIAIAFGVLLTLLRRDVLLLVVGIYSVVFPIVRTFLVTERKQHFLRELPIVLFGLFMVAVSFGEIEELIFTVCGIGAVVVSAIYLLWGLATMKLRFAAYEEYLQELALLEAENISEMPLAEEPEQTNEE